MKLIANIYHKPGNNQAGMKQMCKTFAMHLDQDLPSVIRNNNKNSALLACLLAFQSA